MAQPASNLVQQYAGASIQDDVMLVKGRGDETVEQDALGLSSAFDLLSGVIIDQHFAERGRIGRLLGAVAQKQTKLGIGIDEDTAIRVKGHMLEVIGSRGVTIVDAADSDFTNFSEQQSDGKLIIHAVKLHQLSEGSRFDLARKLPLAP